MATHAAIVYRTAEARKALVRAVESLNVEAPPAPRKPKDAGLETALTIEWATACIERAAKALNQKGDDNG